MQKTMDILKEIEKRSQYYLPIKGVDPAYLAFDRKQDTTALIIPERYFLNAYSKKPEILRDYSVAGILDLAELYSPYVDLRFSLYYFIKGHVDKILISCYKDSLYVPDKPKDSIAVFSPDVNYLSVPADYPELFMHYIEALENWISSGVQPTDSLFAEYNSIDASLLDMQEPFASRYSKRSMLIREKLKNERLSPLCELAEVIEPEETDIAQSDVKYIWNHAAFSYPLDPSYFHNGKAMKIPLQKGDILFCYGADRLQINYIPEAFSDPCYCPSLTTIVRPHDGVSADYLFLYLTSDVGATIIGDKIRGSVFQYLKKSEIEDLPIIRPKRSQKQYQRLFELNYLQQKRLDIFSSCYQRQPVDTIEDLLNEELSAKALKCRDKLARDMISSDLEEIKACFAAGAYKATLIMAGSVMEAFLIDWLSELEGKDYFKEPILNESGKEANLLSIIARVEDIKRPSWMQEAKQAHFIRKKRNLVHAKLCLDENEKINAQYRRFCF